MDAALVILQLLFGFESLLAPAYVALESVLLQEFEAVFVDLLGRAEGGEADLTGLYLALNAAFVTEVGAAQI